MQRKAPGTVATNRKNNMQFKTEVGAIIAEDGGLINMFDGEPGHVDFPDEMIARIHQMRPGYIQRFTHTHPPGMWKPSSQDNSMMSNLAVVMYPFPVRLGIIVPLRGSIEEGHDLSEKYYQFMEYVYQWVFEPKEIWKKKKIVQNDIQRPIVYTQVDSTLFRYRKRAVQSWRDWIIERSYNE